MTAQEARLHLRYSGWASRKLLEAAQALTDEQRQRPMSVSHDSLQQTLAHIYFADAVWYKRVVDAGAPAPGPQDRPSMETLAAAWPELQSKWEKWSDSLTDAGLERRARYRFTNGSEGETPVWQILMHVVNHATLHRGQVVAMLRQLGQKPPATDLIWYYRELESAAAV